MQRRFFKNASILTITQLIITLRGLIVIPLLTRHFGTISYGVWSQIGVLIATLSPIIIFQTDAALLRMLPGHKPDLQKRWFSAWLLFLTSVCATVSVLLIIFNSPVTLFFFGGTDGYIHYIPLAAASLTISVAINCIKNWFRVQENALVFSLIEISQAVANLLALLIMLLQQKGIYDLVLYSIVAELLLVCCFLIYITFTDGWRRPDFSIVLPLLKFGLPLVPAGYAMWGLNYMDRLFLVKYTTFSEIGVYGVAYSIGYMIIPLLMHPLRTMYPSTAAELYNKGQLANLQQLFEQSAGTALALSLPAAVGLFIIGKSLLSLIATQDFVDGAPILGLIAGGYIFHVLSHYYTVALGLVYHQYLSTIAIILAFLTNLILNFLLIPEYSILGAAISTNLAFLMQLIMTFLFARRYRVLTTPVAFPVKILLSTIAMALIVYFFDLKSADFLNSLYLKIGIEVIMGILIYAIFLFIFNILSMNRIRVALSIIKQ